MILKLYCNRNVVDWIWKFPVKDRLWRNNRHCPAGACEFLPICWTGNGRSMARGTLRPSDPQLWRLFDVEFANGLTLERAPGQPGFPSLRRQTGRPHGMERRSSILDRRPKSSSSTCSTSRATWSPSGILNFVWTVHRSSPVSPCLFLRHFRPAPFRLIAGLYDVNTEGTPRILTESGEDHFCSFTSSCSV